VDNTLLVSEPDRSVSEVLSSHREVVLSSTLDDSVSVDLSSDDSSSGGWSLSDGLSKNSDSSDISSSISESAGSSDNGLSDASLSELDSSSSSNRSGSVVFSSESQSVSGSDDLSLESGRLLSSVDSRVVSDSSGASSDVLLSVSNDSHSDDSSSVDSRLGSVGLLLKSSVSVDGSRVSSGVGSSEDSSNSKASLVDSSSDDDSSVDSSSELSHSS